MPNCDATAGTSDLPLPAEKPATAPLKISLLVSDLSPQGAGRWGGAVRPFLLSQALSQAGHQVEIIGFGGDAAAPLETPVPVRRLSPSPSQNLPAAAAKLIQHLQGDIVYAYKLKPSSYGLALLSQLRRRRPLLLDIDDWELSWHGGDRWRYRPSLRQLGRDLRQPNGLCYLDHPLYLRWIERLVPLADQITTHSGFLQKRFGGALVPNGKDLTLFDPAQHEAAACRQAYGLSAYRVLMFPGAPRPYKGVEDVLAALDLIDEADLKLVIVGGSPYDDYDSELHQRWPQRLIQLPKFAYTDMPKLIAAAHVIVVPQRDRPEAQAQFPLKLTDGMAMAKPILATRVGDIPSILATTGYLAKPGDPADLAVQIRQIFSRYDQALERGQQARRRCQTHYSIEAMSQRLDTVLSRFSAHP